MNKHRGGKYESLLVINKDEIIPYVTKAIQEQDEKVANLERENKALKMTVEELIKRIEKIESKEELE